jgi:VIT1/CCC1 family predicted Fe2+/Mn2+ transporter
MGAQAIPLGVDAGERTMPATVAAVRRIRRFDLITGEVGFPNVDNVARACFDRIMSTERDSTTETSNQHLDEPHRSGLAQRLNWLRAGVLGANDGIVSVAAIVVGVAGATTASGPILTAGVAGLVGGSLSMALGEYVSVSSQRDSEHALIEKERRELAEMPDEELAELAGLYEQTGLSPETARQVAIELTEKDALRAHLSTELNIDPDDVVSPWHATFASALAFLLGGVLPLLAIALPPASWRLPVTFVSVLVALAVTGAIGAHIGESGKRVAAIRVVVGGAAALAATFGIGRLLGMSGLV